MKNKFKSLAIAFSVIFSLSSQGQVLKFIGTSTDNEGANVVIGHPTNSNLLVGGTSGGEAAIFEITTSGTVVNTWTFDVKTSIKDYINRLSIDSDGHLIGCGISGTTNNQYDGFAFRFNLSTGSLLWQHETTTGNLEDIRYFECIDMPATNELLIAMSIRDQNDPSEQKVEAAIIKLNRSTGAANVSSLRQYSNNLQTNQDDGFYSSRLLNGVLYISGRGKIKSGSAGNSRATLVEIDITGTYGNVISSNLYVASVSATAEMRARDFTFMNSNTKILAGVDGPISGSSSTNNEFVLLEKTIAGGAHTFRRYRVSGASGIYLESIKEVSGGALIYLRDRNNHDLYLARYTISGSTYTIDWAKRYDNFTSITASLPGRRDGMLVNSGTIYMVSETSSGASFDALFGAVDLATGEITGSEDCTYDATITLQETSTSVTNFGYTDPGFPYSSTLNTPSLVNPVFTTEDVCSETPVDSCEYQVSIDPRQNSDCEWEFSAIITGVSGSALAYHWDFGDGTTSTEANPVHQYFSAGSYTVTVTVYSYYFDGTSYVCCSKTDQFQTIEVTDPCDPCPEKASFIATEVCCGTYSFDAIGTYANTIVFWRFGDGTTGTGDPVLHSYSASGSYPVTMIAMYTDGENCCITEHKQTIEVTCDDLPGVAGKRTASQSYDDQSDFFGSDEVEEAVSEESFGTLELFPNPATNELRLVSPASEIQKVTLIDNLGREAMVVKTQSGNTTSIDIAKLESGVYHVVVNTAAGVEYGRVVKK